ncbi:hypothetical protein COU17_02080 [Candidatus Kaiserbacteria bacterium CG10_big_fil_rev_8_21_14_0_10_49_17]|uniref:Uncharacterized protein n=1 Tax=Candidatus Kaiserbacteria bacterium CG10_big_fil_rev_8_21_14_0_10_49_17 TaxID=1974609 RepID=A0A2M6WEC0_9BACT|nr:MAG: hypothetical protein COU17_02080 [Candidatus Kaiserbacteria bacterium CG10_big_fil_rev_8_21_14_0_10_49_17]
MEEKETTNTNEAPDPAFEEEVDGVRFEAKKVEGPQTNSQTPDQIDVAAAKGELEKELGSSGTPRTETQTPPAPVAHAKPNAPAPQTPSTSTQTEGTPPSPMHPEVRKPGVAESLIAPIRTFKGDIAEAVKHQRASLISITAAEENRRAQAPQPTLEEKRPGTTKRLIIAGLAGGLVVAGLAAIFFVFFYKQTQTVSVPEDVPSLVFVDSQSFVNISNKGRRAILADLTAEKETVRLTLGSLGQLIPYEERDTGPALLTGREFLEAIEVRAPNELLRVLDDTYTLGAHVFNGNQAFLILQPKIFKNAFAGMLEWEPYLVEDLAPLFGEVLPDRVPEFIDESATTTATSTPTQTGTLPGELVRKFEDIVLRNKDVRALKNDAGKIVLLYTFPDQQTLIITTNEFTLTEILTRFSTTRVF